MINLPRPHTTPTSHTSASPAARKRGWFWPALIVTFIGANMAVCATTVYYATTDRSFAVEPGYDRKARDWDQTARERDQSSRLGWSAAWTLPSSAGGPVVLTLKDRDGRTITDATVRVVAFHHARAAQAQELTIVADADGTLAARIRLDRAGVWEFRISADRAGSRFVAMQTLNVGAAIVQEAAP